MTTACVTGSASGLGAAIRRRLEADGTTVIGVDLADAEVVADLSVPEARTAMAHAVADRCDGSLDRLVACAGVGPHVADLGLICSVNYFGAVATLDHLLPLLRRGDDPAAVAVCSNSMGIVPPDPDLLDGCIRGDEGHAREAAGRRDGTTVYATSKLALGRSLRARATEWGAARVRLNGVAPGPLATPLLRAVKDDPVLGELADTLPIPLGREGDPAEVAEIVAYLLGPATAWVHGSILFVDGGTDAQIRPDHA